jgi:hypothetical protein
MTAVAVMPTMGRDNEAQRWLDKLAACTAPSAFCPLRSAQSGD